MREVIPSTESDERQARTYNIPLPHNSVSCCLRTCFNDITELPTKLLIMHASTQEKFKHSIPPQPTIDIFRPSFPRKRPEPSESAAPAPSNDEDEDYETSNCRINITFRFYRPDFVPTTTPRCKCGQPCILRPDMKGRNDRSPDGRRAEGKGKEPLDEEQIRYWWTCYAAAQDGGKGCGMWKVMDMKAEGRGPCIGSGESR